MEWIPVEDKLPGHGKNVIATYKNGHDKNRIIIGHYLERFREESDCGDECCGEYHKETDKYYYCEGWYEQQDNNSDFSSMFVSEGTVTHWMPLPEFPKANDEPQEKTCLTCSFEPGWESKTSPWDRKVLLEPAGFCRLDIKAPGCVSIMRSIIFKFMPIKNCPAWRPK